MGSMKHLASVARHLGLQTLARWLTDNREAVRAELVASGRSPAAHFRVVSGCASPEAPCAPAREAPTLPPVGSRWFLHEGGDRPRDRAVKVTGYVNADAPGSERDPGAVFDWPVVLFEYEDTGEAGRLYLTAFAAGAVRAPPAQPPLREALERLADAHDVPTVSTARSTFAPAVAEELVRLGLARLGPPRFASQNEPSLDITPAGMDLYRRWSTRAGAPAAAHVEGPYHHLVYDERPDLWVQTGKNAWTRTVGATTVSIQATGSMYGNDPRRTTQKWMVAAVHKGQADVVEWHAHAWRDSLADALATARAWWRTGYSPSRDQRVDPERGDTWRTPRGDTLIVLHADAWTVATSADPAALSFDWRARGNQRWSGDDWREQVARAAWMGTTEPVPGARSRRG